MRRTGKVAVIFLSVAGVWGAAGLWGCRATVAGDPNRPIKIEAHVTIDVRQIKQEAHSIEDMVSGGSAAPANRKPVSLMNERWVSWAWAEAALDPQVEQAVNSRRARFGQLKEYKAQGWVGEDREGHVAALGGGPEVQSLVEAENSDREIIYQATLKQRGLPSDALGTIRATFAQEQRERAEPGEKIQAPSGEWATK